ncbi:hypothetical protein H4S06_001074 [Coemansia sp. BCRC 34490]|nr:hypothetical protein H4S06_001074 [Coemansia sp. BCRC 34490]
MQSQQNASLAVALLAAGLLVSATAPATASSHIAAASATEPASLTDAQKASSANAAQLGDAATIVCQINADRKARYELPVFVHGVLNQAAADLGNRYANGTFSDTLFDEIYSRTLAPLGGSVYASYKILGSFSSDLQYVRAVEQAIYSSLFARNLQAVGVFQNAGVYTLVLATGLTATPASVDACPASPVHPYYPPGSGGGGSSNVMNGIDLPSFLCSLNDKRSAAGSSAFAVHRALENEALQQAKQMVSLGHYTVDGPRKVDQSIYDQNVAVKKLYWFAGDRYTNARSLVELLMASYADTVLDPSYSVIGVAQLNGFWSLIMAELYSSVSVRFACPLSIDEVTFVS